jgi:hypothetical protein
MAEAIPAYPLQWPTGWKRTRFPRHSKYKVSFTTARDELVRELRLMGARHIVVSTNVPLRRDGLPYAAQREPEDAGVAVYWATPKNEPRVIAADCWRKVKDNLRAVGLAVQALRQIDRTGASEILEHAFTGFAALPAPTETARHWKTVLGLELDPQPTAAAIERAYRRRALDLHPDRGGDEAGMVELNRARERALAWLGR